jgi:RNA-directed DNA polymerase
LQPEQYAYRPHRSALDAVKHVHALLNRGYTEVVDAELRGYFDSIPHAELLKSVSRRVSDRHVLQLIKMGRQAPVEETDAHGRPHRTTRNKDTGRGSPQGTIAPDGGVRSRHSQNLRRRLCMLSASGQLRLGNR